MVNQRLQPTRRTLTGNLLLLGILGVWGWAEIGWAGQAPPTPTPPAAQKTTGVTAAPPVTKKVATPATTKQTRGRRGGTAAEAQPVPTPVRSAPAIVGRRDPFKLPPPPGPPGQQAAEDLGPALPGVRGLIISQLILQGIVRLDTTNMMIAVVTNYTKRAYFLRENDAVRNGVVSKITPDAVYFQENYLDQYGRASAREVMKRLGSAPGEGR